MNEHPHMKPLGDAARDEAEADVDPELSRPFDAAELDALTRGVGARLSRPRRVRPLWKPAVFGAASGTALSARPSTASASAGRAAIRWVLASSRQAHR